LDVGLQAGSFDADQYIRRCSIDALIEHGKSPGIAMRQANESSNAPISVSAIHIVPPDKRIATGKALRDKAPRELHGGWKVFNGRPNPIDLLKNSEVGRVKAPLPIRYGRMLQSPFTLYRGSAGRADRSCERERFRLWFQVVRESATEVDGRARFGNSVLFRLFPHCVGVVSGGRR
jgi:hypothetical protein